MMVKNILLIFCCFLGICANAQLSSTSMYSMDIIENKNGIDLTNLTLLSGFNKGGYNNQPSFFDESNLYITSNHYDRDFTDFIRLDLEDEIYYRITATDDISEFSPNPNAPNGYFSAVRIEADGKTQSLWLYPNDHTHEGKRILSKVGQVGYHCWISEEEVALFLVDEPNQLVIANIETNKKRLILEKVGRCMTLDKSGRLVLVHKVSDQKWYIKKLDIDSGRLIVVHETLNNSEDFVLLQDGSFLMASQSKIFKYHPLVDVDWSEIVDLSAFGINNINRLASNGKKLILVSDDKE